MVMLLFKMERDVKKLPVKVEFNKIASRTALGLLGGAIGYSIATAFGLSAPLVPILIGCAFAPALSNLR